MSDTKPTGADYSQAARLAYGRDEMIPVVAAALAAARAEGQAERDSLIARIATLCNTLTAAEQAAGVYGTPVALVDAITTDRERREQAERELRDLLPCGHERRYNLGRQMATCVRCELEQAEQACARYKAALVRVADDLAGMATQVRTAPGYEATERALKLLALRLYIAALAGELPTTPGEEADRGL